MPNEKCPKCGSDTDAPCSCGELPAVNGAGKHVRFDPPPPSEAANWVIEPVPPEIVEHFRQTFNEADYLAEVRELERTGGVDITEMLAEVERIAHGKE